MQDGKPSGCMGQQTTERLVRVRVTPSPPRSADAAYVDGVTMTDFVKAWQAHPGYECSDNFTARIAACMPSKALGHGLISSIANLLHQPVRQGRRAAPDCWTG